MPGSSDPIDGAVDTLLAGAGVCRDFAHLCGGVVAGRERSGPGRLGIRAGTVSDDFHAVAEAFVDGQWRVVDGTLLARRGKRWCGIATGRDAADIAFLDNHKGAITLTKVEVTAIVHGELPRDSIDQLVSIG
ncbi:transglutaminase family protein [Mycobacterium sp. NPDC048908]|uniref:transglutaminase-like domain-containing protein n=1 Tax=Mycobacterium sp. NPDC048908 TaxID=3364292 RepID=UPI0037161CED